VWERTGKSVIGEGEKRRGIDRERDGRGGKREKREKREKGGESERKRTIKVRVHAKRCTSL
jgi:hypothetical protein